LFERQYSKHPGFKLTANPIFVGGRIFVWIVMMAFLVVRKWDNIEPNMSEQYDAKFSTIEITKISEFVK